MGVQVPACRRAEPVPRGHRDVICPAEAIRVPRVLEVRHRHLQDHPQHRMRMESGRAGQRFTFWGPLTNSYELVQFHSHWGDDHSCGSEHTVDGKAYAGELHFVHWNREKFPSCADAVPSPTGLTVIAVFLEVGEENSEIEKLCQVLSKIPTKDERTDLPSDLDPVAMFPADAATSYWTYSGSLTTPPCYESVTWIVFKQPITVSQEQLNYFRQMKKPCAEDGFVLKNYRPPQSLNDREIFECA
ncbi:carbonic anhydrase 2 [Caerostris extrusa]|uniref:Carbonic anhydrase n=1 Tax=Caerostris extrusa TaxID=172846 RepID=A0AAV4QHQ4_CAEEX|nr:carbonic anhydrase 2 [Caerostris extrusa]